MNIFCCLRRALLGTVLFVGGPQLYAQAPIVFTIQVGSDPVVTSTISGEAQLSFASSILATVASGTSATTLTANATNSQTTLQVASILGVTTCMGILTGSELSSITGIAGTGPYTLTVSRGALGTTKAAYSSGQVASFTAWGNASCYVTAKFILSAQGGMITNPGPAIAALQAAIAASNASIVSTVAAGFTHTP